MAKVWDVHFVKDGIALMGNAGAGWWGILYDLFPSEAAAVAYASCYPYRHAVIQHREWHHTFIDSPFVTDHRKEV